MTHGDAPFVALSHTDGACARVYLDGAQVASWIPAGSSDDRLFVSRKAQYGAGRSIRGGIPVCFPQFGTRGPLMQHGFARQVRWSLLREVRADDGARTVLQLSDTEATRVAWPHAFHAEVSVHVAGATLTVELNVINTDARPFEFTAALHPYFSVRDAFATSVQGLSGIRYQDAVRGGEYTDQDAAVVIDGHIDRVYADTPDVLEVVEPHRTLRIEKRGFPDAVVWNPGVDITASKPDFVPGDERHMLCVEAGAIMRPISLTPGARWTGTQVMTAVDSASPPV